MSLCFLEWCRPWLKVVKAIERRRMHGGGGETGGLVNKEVFWDCFAFICMPLCTYPWTVGPKKLLNYQPTGDFSVRTLIPFQVCLQQCQNLHYLPVHWAHTALQGHPQLSQHVRVDNLQDINLLHIFNATSVTFWDNTQVFFMLSCWFWNRRTSLTSSGRSFFL